MDKIGLKALAAGIFLAVAFLAGLAWSAGRACVVLMRQEDKTAGVWFYVLFTGALFLAAAGALTAGIFKTILLFR